MAPEVASLVRAAGAAAAVIAALLALLAIRPRQFEVLKLDAVRSEALDLPSVQTRRLLLDTDILAWKRNQDLLQHKASRLLWALVLLFVAVLTYGGGILATAMGDVS